MTQKTFKVADKLRAADAALKAGHLDEARALYAQIIARFPGSTKAKTGLARVEKRIAIGSGLQTPDQMLRAGHAAEDRGDLPRAIALYETVLARQPNRPDAINDLGMALLSAGQTARSLEVLQNLAHRAPRIAEAHINLARSYVEAEKYPEAIESCRTALKIAPTHPVALCNLGSLYARLGDLDNARACFETCVAHNPAHTDAYDNIVQAKRVAPDDPIIGKMQAALADAPLNDRARASLHFSLGKVMDDIGDTAAAFDHYTAANDLSKATRRFDFEGAKRSLTEMRDVFAAPGVPRLTAADTGPAPVTPIFIVGMPRSGSTLIEQVFSSHSQVAAAGEIDALPRIVDAKLRATTDAKTPVDRQTLLDIRRAYLDRLAQVSQGKPYVTDKNLLNFRYVGLIEAAFPEAIIVHMTRDPVAVWWSNYRQNFASDAFCFAFDLDQMGAYYTAYAQVMEDWRQTLPGRIVEVDYDAFTAAPEAQTRALLDRCGMDFEEACLEFPARGGVVTSASLYQVREKVYRGSSKAWEAYRPYLAPFIEKYLPDAAKR